MTPAQLKEAVRRGEAVERFLESEHVSGLWTIIEADLYGMWAATRSEGTDKREELYRELHGLKALQARLRRMAQEGRKARHELDRNGD